MAETLLVLLVCCAAIATVNWIWFVRDVSSGLRLRRRGDPSADAVLSLARWPGSMAFLSTLTALPLAANWLGELGGPWALVGQVVINLLVQPFCLYLVSA